VGPIIPPGVSMISHYKPLSCDYNSHCDEFSQVGVSTEIYADEICLTFAAVHWGGCKSDQVKENALIIQTCNKVRKLERGQRI